MNSDFDVQAKILESSVSTHQELNEQDIERIIANFKFICDDCNVHATGSQGENLAEWLYISGYPKLAEKFAKEMKIGLDLGKVEKIKEKV